MAASTAACSFDRSGLPAGDGGSDDAVVLPDGPSGIDGGLDAGPDGGDPDASVDAETCTTACVGNGYRDCDAAGAIVPCSVGCMDDATGPRCLALVPSNGADRDDVEDTSALFIPAGAIVIDTDTGEIYDTDGQGAVYRQAGEGLVGDENDLNPTRFTVLSDSVSELAVASLTLGPGSYVLPIGTRALIILSAGDVFLAGRIDLGGGHCDNDDDTCPGAGGGYGQSSEGPAEGCGPGGAGFAGSGDETGGGGGGLGQAGAPGGNGGGGNEGGLAGSIADCPGATLIPLVGGSGGGAGGNATGGTGGGGAGALQITSLTSVSVTTVGSVFAIIYAGGAPGHEGHGSSGGGGGGAGGGILLEAPTVVLTGAVLAANGGSGGDGREHDDGGYGGETTQPTPGGGTGNSRGGNSGALIPPTAGAGPTDGTGGGGAGSGIIRLNTYEPLINVASVLSPTPSTGAITTE